MQLGCVDRVLKQPLLKFDFLKLQLQMLLQLLLIYPELKRTQSHFCNLVAKLYFFPKEIYQFFFKFVCLKSHFSLLRSLIASSARSVSNYANDRWMTPASGGLFHTKRYSFCGNSNPLFLYGDTELTNEML